MISKDIVSTCIQLTARSMQREPFPEHLDEDQDEQVATTQLYLLRRTCFGAAAEAPGDYSVHNVSLIKPNILQCHSRSGAHKRISKAAAAHRLHSKAQHDIMTLFVSTYAKLGSQECSDETRSKNMFHYCSDAVAAGEERSIVAGCIQNLIA